MRRFILLFATGLYSAECEVIQPQCQCIKPPSDVSQPCLPYDSRFQAATLEEAMVSFPDLSIDQGEPGQITTLQEKANCQTKECLDCQKEIRKQLKKIGLMPAAITDVLEAQNTTTCKQYRFSRKDKGVYGFRGKGKHSSSSSSEEDHKRKRKGRKQKMWWLHRDKRQTTHLNTSGQAIVGERFVLSCTAKGMAPDSSNTVSLCSSCWIWRRLPDNYSPQYINELLCDTSDSSCLSGYATCGVGHRAVEVVLNNSGVIKTVALSAGSYCECRATLNSAIEPLVTGAGLSSSLPAVSSTTASASRSN